MSRKAEFRDTRALSASAVPERITRDPSKGLCSHEKFVSYAGSRATWLRRSLLKIALLKVQELNSMSAVVLTNLLLPEHASVSSV